VVAVNNGDVTVVGLVKVATVGVVVLVNGVCGGGGNSGG
jgi:hypothetical protein